MTRQEHLDWCKKRALEYVKTGDNNQAFTSMCSDLMKHEETRHHETTNRLGIMMLMAGHLKTSKDMEKWINGYN